MTFNNTLPEMPPRARALVEEYESLRELGASKTVRMIVEVLTIIAQEGTYGSSAELIQAIQQSAAYFRETRGRITPAVGNALRRVLAGLTEFRERPLPELQGFIVSRANEFNRDSLAHVARISRFAANLIADRATVLAYDYSGTVVSALEQAAEDGKQLAVIVPESRTLNGGRPIVERVVKCGHRVNFVADAVISYWMPKADLVLEGVETLLAGGDFLGTPGTFTVGLVARHFGVPFYALAETLKIAVYTLYGPPVEVGHRWLADVFEYPQSFSKPEAVSVESPGLERVPAEFVTAYITENGILPPSAIWYLARQMSTSAGSDESFEGP